MSERDALLVSVCGIPHKDKIVIGYGLRREDNVVEYFDSGHLRVYYDPNNKSKSVLRLVNIIRNSVRGNIETVRLSGDLPNKSRCEIPEQESFLEQVADAIRDMGNLVVVDK